jgi:hypothetical protein
MSGELLALEERKATLVAETEEAQEDLPRLHPGLAEVYHRKVDGLTAALNRDDLRTQAAEAIRSLISAIKLIPHDGELMVELEGELAGILALGKDERPRPFGRGRQSTLVAGARFVEARTERFLTKSV